MDERFPQQFELSTRTLFDLKGDPFFEFEIWTKYFHAKAEIYQSNKFPHIWSFVVTKEENIYYFLSSPQMCEKRHDTCPESFFHSTSSFFLAESES